MELLMKWMDANRAYSNEGQRGVDNLIKLMNAVDSSYNGNFGGTLISFLSDNPGAIEAVQQWIGEQLERNKDWAASLKASFDDPLEEDEEEE